MFRKIRFCHKGMSIVEAIVITGIIAVLSVITMLSWRGVMSGGALKRETQKVALYLERARSMALSSKKDSSGNIPNGFGIYFDETAGNNGKYILYSDCGDSNDPDNELDYRLDYPLDMSPCDSIVEEVIPEKWVRIKVNYPLPPPDPVNIDFLFIPPDPEVYVNGSAGGGEVEVCTLDGSRCNKISVNSIGQIDVP
jgi:type II secretory pathway pseudopilin PulG